MKIDRRSFLATGSAAAVAGSFLESLSQISAAERRGRAPIGIQLYAVRGAFAKDVAGTLNQLSSIGYDGVEFWGYNGTPNVFQDYSAEHLKEMLDKSQLKCCGMHLGLRALEADRFDHTVAVNKTLGNPYLNVAAAKQKMESPATIKQFAKELNALADKARKYDMRVGYHCHPFDMKRFDGKSGWELLFSQTDPAVMMQMDTGNCAGGGGDPLAVLRQFPHRAVTVHIKEFDQAVWAKGNKIWTEIFHVCETMHPLTWYIVEQGEQGGNDLVVAKQSIKNLHAMGK